jgi:small neutral amino acid transporter SnatA (MarC family)
MNTAAIASLSLALFLLMDPIGNIPIFISVLKKVKPKRQKIIIFRELIIALIIIIFFNFLGEYLLHLLKISQPTVQIAGGVILFLISIKMIFPPQKGAHQET